MAFLKGLGIEDPRELFEVEDGATVRATPLRSTTRLDGPDGTTFFLKRYRPGAGRAGRIHRSSAPAQVEWAALEALPAIGVAAPEPVVGVWTTAGDRGPSCVLLRAVPGQPLDDALDRGEVGDSWLLDELVPTVARLHVAGYQHRDLYAAHVFYRGAGHPASLIDLARVRPSRTGRLSRRRRVKDLAALAYSLGPRLRSALLLRMFERYCVLAGLGPRTASGLIRRVLRKRRAIARHVPVHG